MADPMACWDTLLINGTDIRVLGAYITNASGLLSGAPQKGDLIEPDWTAGAIWQAGPKGTYSFDVPIIMTSRIQSVAIGQLRNIQAYVGPVLTLGRRLTVNGVDITETCSAVMSQAVEVNWEFERRQQMRAVLIFQNLTGGWS